jgi:hypothetical protein
MEHPIRLDFCGWRDSFPGTIPARQITDGDEEVGVKNEYVLATNFRSPLVRIPRT